MKFENAEFWGNLHRIVAVCVPHQCIVLRLLALTRQMVNLCLKIFSSKVMSDVIDKIQILNTCLFSELRDR